jgi:hypothetical protein
MKVYNAKISINNLNTNNYKYKKLLNGYFNFNRKNIKISFFINKSLGFLK